MKLALISLLVGAICSLANAAPRSEPEAMVVSAADLAELERQRDRKPNRYQGRDELGLAYYRFARAAFDRGEFPVYERHLELAMNEWLASLRIEPRNPSPHTFMGIVSAYQGRIDDALDSMHNARSLMPSVGVAYTNIAETLIYAGRDAREVETWLSRGERMGVNPAIMELNFCLLRWRDGNLEAAARNFYRAAKLDPEVVRVWNEAPVTTPIKTFEDLRHYCCGSPACGPYLARACVTSKEEVAKREIPEETALRELRIEMERRRELERIYRKRKELDVRVKDADDDPAPGNEPAPKSEPAP